MEESRAREIVIEIERIKTIRKTCRTRVMFCPDCAAEADFISLNEAVELFEVDIRQLRAVIRHHVCDVSGNEGDILICVASFLAEMRTMTGGAQIGDSERETRSITG